MIAEKFYSKLQKKIPLLKCIYYLDVVEVLVQCTYINKKAWTSALVMLQIDSSEQVVKGIYIKRLLNFVSTKTQLQICNNVCKLHLSLASKAKDQAEKLQLISLGPTAILLKTAEMGAHQTVRNVSLLTLGPKQWLAHQCWHPPPPHMMCGKLLFLQTPLPET